MIGLGCMRLSTDAGRDIARARLVLAAALDAGVNVLDTSDAYALDDADRGHNERLVGEAIVGRDVRVITKGGLVRPGGAWVPDGRARHLAEAARASRERLGVGAIDVYLLHAVDPRTALATSVRALAKLRDAGVARAIGLSNIGVHQLEQARAITAIDAVEVELSPWNLDAARGGLVAACERHGITLYAHRPLGGAAGVRRLERDDVIAQVAARLGATPAEIALAWLRRLSPVVVPLPGATREETARSAARSAAIVLDDDAMHALDARFRDDAHVAATTSTGEIVLVVGMPAAGKSTLAARLAADGYLRLNRDERGGSLAELARELDRALADGATRVVLDNTYATRALRARPIAIARRRGVPIRCIVVSTPLERAQHHAVARLLEQHGRLLEPDELARAGAIGPSAQFRFRRQYEPPDPGEGFASIEEFAPPLAPTSGRAAAIVELSVLTRGGELDPAVAERLRAYARDGYALAATAWQPDPADTAAIDARISAQLGLALPVARCHHPAGPPVCWCRKPLPGLALVLAREHGFDLARSVHLGRSPADRGFALRAGLAFELV
jgi:aryl-alcohol dehydrogenase-like predicted oxidoreductase